jgi:hypothetical protein
MTKTRSARIPLVTVSHRRSKVVQPNLPGFDKRDRPCVLSMVHATAFTRKRAFISRGVLTDLCPH